MTGKLKVLGLALVAIFALSALTASAAQAQGKFTWASGTAKLTATQDSTVESEETGWQKFTTTSGQVLCKGVHGEATVSGTENAEVTAQNISYTNCQFGGFAVQIALNGCDELFTVGTTIGITGMETTGQAHLKCPEIGGVKQQITVQATGFCQIHIPEQTPTGGHIIYHTITGTPNYVTIEKEITGVQVQGTGICTSTTNGTYRGNIIVKGYQVNETAQTSIEVH